MYLETAASNGLQQTLLLSELGALMEVIKSTDMGIELIVSVDVQAGQVLSGLTRAIEWATAALAASTISSHALLFINGIADQLSGLLFVTLLSTVGFWMFIRILPVARVFKRAARSIVETFAVLLLVSYFVLPYTINVTGWLSQTLAGSLQVNTQSAVENFHKDTFRGESLRTNLKFWTSSNNVRATYDEVTTDLHDKVSALTRYAIERFASLLIVGILFPLSVVLILTMLLRRLLLLGFDTFHDQSGKTGPVGFATQFEA